jgi:5-carboxymethyl-2-hydroxymuconate isomerase
MPHLVLHHSANLEGFDAPSCLVAVNTALAASGHFEEADIKSRALQLEAYHVGTTGSSGRGFVAAQLRVLAGRSDETKKALSQLALGAILRSMHQTTVQVQVTAEVVDIHRASYAKSLVERADPSAKGGA